MYSCCMAMLFSCIFMFSIKLSPHVFHNFQWYGHVYLCFQLDYLLMYSSGMAMLFSCIFMFLIKLSPHVFPWYGHAFFMYIYVFN